MCIAVRIKFFASLRDVTGVAVTTWTGQVETIGDLLRALAAEYGESFADVVLADGRLSTAVTVMIDGDNALLHGGDSARIADGTEISLFPLLSGG